MSYTDSVLFSLPIMGRSPSGGFLVDLTPVFFGDLPQISLVLKGFQFAPDRSTWASIKGFKDNVEIEVAATYASAGVASSETIPDTRGATLYIHYSISRLKETGYQPRLADDRLGHFMTVIKDYSKTGEDDQFVRYVNRWDLRKSEPGLAVSPPVTPIIFWIEKTVPYKYRAAVREGILEWNKTFERAGFSNAIEVRQQPDDAAWDPEDINYNTFRWITADAGFARGPSRVNPSTGQILDADIIFDAGFVEKWTATFEINRVGKDKESEIPVLPFSRPSEEDSPLEMFRASTHRISERLYAEGMAQQMAFGAMALAATGKGDNKELIEKLLFQGVRSVTTHEVGHTLGLRHNFKASAYWTMDEMNDPDKTRDFGLASSVMDYLPVNMSPKGKPQGDFFSLVPGPYDYWVIEYAYKPLPGGTQGEVGELQKIASRCADPTLQYATDEDAHGLAPDPLVNLFDLGKNPMDYARRRLELIDQVLPGLIDQMVRPGEGYQSVRRAFATLISEHTRAMGFVARFIGGIYVHRDHKGDPNARPPLVPVEAARQREALELLEQKVLGPEAYNFPAQLYDYMAPNNWTQWGQKKPPRPDLPVLEMIAAMQDAALERVLAPITLSRLLDAEKNAPAEAEVLSAAELLHRLTASVYAELDKIKEEKFTNRAPAISPVRRNLQQRYFKRLAAMALGSDDVPFDCRNIAAAELDALEVRVRQVLGGKAQLDDYTRTHLTELASRIRKTLDARLELPRP
jgi:hypothetical protein